MRLTLPWELIAAVAVGLALLFAAGKVMIVPMRLVWRICFHGMLGGFGLLGLNVLGAFVGVQLPVNPCAALLAGFLGLPGVALVHVVSLMSA